MLGFKQRGRTRRNTKFYSASKALPQPAVSRGKHDLSPFLSRAALLGLLAGVGFAVSAQAANVVGGDVLDNGGSASLGAQSDPWNVGGALVVGDTSNGTLDISAGSIVNSASGTIGNKAGSTGVVTVDGDGSKWTNTGSLEIGKDGDGTLTVSNGGVTTATGITLGAGGGSGTLNIGDGGAAGIVDAPSVAGGTSGGVVNFNHNATDSSPYSFTNTGGTAVTLDGNLAVNNVAGHTVLTGTNTYTGGTAINGGTLEVSSDANLGDAAGGLSFDGGVLAVTGAGFTMDRATTLEAGGGTFDVAGGATLTQDGIISGAGSLTKDGAGTLTLSGANDYTSGTTLNAGRINVGSDTALGSGDLTMEGSTTLGFAANDLSVANDITLNGASTVDTVGNNATLSGIISSDGSLTKTGTGTLTLSGINTYTGGTTITDGTLAISGSGTLGATTGALAINGGTLDLGGTSQTVSSLSGTGGDITNSNLAASTLNVNQSSTTDYAGVIADETGTVALTKSGAGTLTLDGTNSYKGGTAINGGTLQVSNDANLGNAVGGLSFDGGVLAVTGAGFTMDRATTLEAGGGTFDVAGGATLTQDGIISGAGSLTKDGAGMLTLSGANDYTGGTTVNVGTLAGNITDNTDLTVASGATYDGTGAARSVNSLNGDGSVINANGLTAQSGTFGGNMTGVGSLTKTGVGTLTLSGDNGYSGGTTLSAGRIDAGSATALGSGDLTMEAATTLGFAADGLSLANNIALNGAGTVDTGVNNATLAGDISGAAGSLTKLGTGTLTLDGTNSYEGGTTITAGTLQIGPTSTTSQTNLGTGEVDIASGGTLVANTNGAFSFDNALTGSGTLAAGNNSGAFSFGSDVGSAFTGTVALSGNTFDLSGDNTTALTNATLVVGAGNTTTVGSGSQNIGGLTFDGGTMIFDATAPDQKVASDLLTVTDLDVSGTGTVQINVPDPSAPYVLPTPTPAESLSLFAQSHINDGLQLVAADSVTGNASGLILEDQNGNALGNGKSVDIQQGGNMVAVGSYNYTLGTGADNNGLYVGYGLTQLALQAGETLTLTENSGATGNDADMAAKLTGAGNLKIAANNIVSLSNAGNDFTGTTEISSGTLQTGAANVIASSSQVTVDSGATFDLNTFDQGVNNLQGSGTVDVKAATLTATNNADSLFSGVIEGSGNVIKAGTRVLTLSGDNTYAGGTLLQEGQINVGSNTALGSGDLSMSAGTTLGFAAADLGLVNKITLAGVATVDTGAYNDTLSGIISGSGSLTKTGTGTLTLSGANDYTGGTTVNVGTLAGNITDNTNLTVASGATYDGTGAARLVNSLNGDGSVINAAGLTAQSGTFGGNITDVGSLTKTGTGTLTLGGNNTYTGDTIISNGTLAVTGSLGGGNYSGAIVNNGALVLDQNVNQTLSGAISGTGSLTKNGANTLLTLSGDSSGYAGNFTLAQGIVNLAAGAQLGGSFTQNAGTVLTSGNGATLDTATFKGTVTPTGTLNLTSGVFDGAAVDLGLLTAGNNIAATNSVDFANNPTMISVNASGVTGNSDFTLMSFANASNQSNALVIATNLGSNRGGSYFTATTLNYGVLTGPASLTWNGSGAAGSTTSTWNTSTTNKNWSTPFATYFVNDDTVLFDNSAASKNVTVAPGGVSVSAMSVTAPGYTFNLTAGSAPAITASGAIALDDATLNITGYTPDTSITAYPPGGNVETVVTATGGITGFNPLVTVTGQSNVDFLSASTYLDGNNAIKVETRLTWYSTDPNRKANGNFTIADGKTFTLGAVLADNAINLETSPIWNGKTLTKLGGGTLVLTAANTYDGGTNLNAGRIDVGSGSALGSGALAMADGTTLGFAGNYSVGNAIALNGVGTFDTAGNNGTLSGIISGGGDLIKTGASTLTLSGANTYGGVTEVQAGTLALSGAGKVSPVLVLNEGTTFSLTNGATASNLTQLDVYGTATWQGDLNMAGQTVNFYVPTTLANGQTMLNVSGNANVTGSTVNVGINGDQPLLQPGNTLVLIDAASLTGPPANSSSDGQWMIGQGATIDYVFHLSETASQLVATISNAKVSEESKSLSEGFVAGPTLINQTGDFVADKGMAQAVEAAGGGKPGESKQARSSMAGGYGLGTFGAVTGGWNRYNTGSNADVSSFSLVAGLAWGNDINLGRVTFGGFFEYGNGSYDTYNSFAGVPGDVHGKGDMYHLGGGMLGRLNFNETGPGNFYAEAGARAGNVNNDYKNGNLGGYAVNYESDSAYYGIHAGAGYIWSLTEKAALDVYGKYFWTRQKGDSVRLATGDPIRFDDIDSHRLRAGGRFIYAVNDRIAPYAGLAYEQEFDGKAKATAYDQAIAAPSLQGGTGIGEIGLALKPSKDLPLSVDLGVQGYVGTREGVTGSLQVKYEF